VGWLAYTTECLDRFHKTYGSRVYMGKWDVTAAPMPFPEKLHTVLDNYETTY
jgi:hypothetical protein